MISLKIKWDLKQLKALLPSIIKESPKLGPPMIESIEKEMSIGKSPVEGQGRYVAYSPTYQSDIRYGTVKKHYPEKRIRPVNLYLSGAMYKSAESKPVDGGLNISFKDKKAEYHNDMGAGKSKVIRRMLPTKSGETFSRTIMQKTLRILQGDIIGKLISVMKR